MTKSLSNISRFAFARVSSLVRRRPVAGTIAKDRFRPYLPMDPVVVEAGAHIGIDTIELARTWPNGHIHAFEPLPDLFAQLTSRVRHQRNVTCYQLGLGGHTGTAEFFVSGGASNGSSSLLRPTGHLKQHPDVSFRASTMVPVTTLDQWAEAHRVDRIDLLWLDMQGAELGAMQAAHRTLATTRLVYMEVSLVELYAGAPLYPEVRRWMNERGFSVLIEALAWEDAGNVLFGR